MVVSWTPEDVGRVLERLEALVAGLPGVVTEDSFGHIGFMVGRKRFAWLFLDHHGDGSLAASAGPRSRAASEVSR